MENGNHSSCPVKATRLGPSAASENNEGQLNERECSVKVFHSSSGQDLETMWTQWAQGNTGMTWGGGVSAKQVVKAHNQRNALGAILSCLQAHQ